MIANGNLEKVIELRSYGTFQNKKGESGTGMHTYKRDIWIFVIVLHYIFKTTIIVIGSTSRGGG